jgi:hypothetical protein
MNNTWRASGAVDLSRGPPGGDGRRGAGGRDGAVLDGAQSYAITDRLREQEEAAEAPRGPIPLAAAAEGRLRSGSGPQ